MDNYYDIVIAGCGVAGLSAAVSAIESLVENLNEDITVAVIDRASKEESGGNSKWTGAYLRLQDEKTISPNFREDMINFSGGHSDINIIEKLATEAPNAISWAKGKGVDFEYLPTIFINQSKPRLLPVGGGRQVVDTLTKEVEKMGVTIFYETTAKSIVLNEQGGVEGLYVSNKDMGYKKVRTKSLILATGGFQGNAEMTARYLGNQSYKLKPIAEGGAFNKGEGIQMCIDIGGKTFGQLDSFHAEPVDPRSNLPEAVVMLFPYGILVDTEGHRFVDEGEATIDETYEKIARTIWKLSDQVAYCIVDQKLFNVPNYKRGLETDQEPIIAESVEELAAKLNINSNTLKTTIEQFNSSVQKGNYDPMKPDGVCTKGIFPAKSNWALPIDSPPFVAYPVACANVFTYGGVATDTWARVLNADDIPVPGLYAVGEMAGLYYHKYPGATSFLRAMVYGRISGKEAVKYVMNK